MEEPYCSISLKFLFDLALAKITSVTSSKGKQIAVVENFQFQKEIVLKVKITMDVLGHVFSHIPVLFL